MRRPRIPAWLAEVIYGAMVALASGATAWAVYRLVGAIAGAACIR